MRPAGCFSIIEIHVKKRSIVFFVYFFFFIHLLYCQKKKKKKHTKIPLFFLNRKIEVKTEDYIKFIFFWSARHQKKKKKKYNNMSEEAINWKTIAVAVSVGTVGIALWKAPEIYDSLIVKMTGRWYEVVLSQMKDGEHVADIGIGTAGALLQNKELLQKKKIKVTGIDYDNSYIIKAKQVVASAGLSDCIQLECKSFYDDDVVSRKGLYDSVYFSGSFTLLPDPQEALNVAADITKPGGLIYITQTYQRKYIPGFAIIKPLLKYLVTIDFGPLTYEKDIATLLDGCGLKVISNEVIPNSVDNKYQSARLIIIQSP